MPPLIFTQMTYLYNVGLVNFYHTLGKNIMHIRHIWTFTKFFLKGKTLSIAITADTLLLSPLHQLSKPAAENTSWLLTISCLQHRGVFSSLPFSDMPRACTGLQPGSQ